MEIIRQFLLIPENLQNRVNIDEFLMYLRKSFLLKSQKIMILDNLETGMIDVNDISLSIRILKEEYRNQKKMWIAGDEPDFESKCIIRKKLNEKIKDSSRLWKQIELYFEEKRAKEEDMEKANEILYKIQNNLI